MKTLLIGTGSWSSICQADGRLYIAMRYVEGSDLSRILREEAPLTPERTLALLGPVADALDADWLFMVTVNGNRDDFAAYLKERGIETNVAHVRNDVFTVFGGKRRKLPGMNEVEAKYLCLPLNTKVLARDVEYVCSAIREYEAKQRG